MLVMISPAKTFTKEEELMACRPLKFEKQTRQLIERLKAYSVEELSVQMKMSETLARINYERYNQFYNESKGKYAIDYYYGEAFKAIQSTTLTQNARNFMNAHVGILSGLYGCLKPLDVIQPYRLEMAFKFSKAKEDQLYYFWKETLTQHVLETLSQISGEKVLINLASEEYSKALDLKTIAREYKVLNIHFKVHKNGQYKAISMYAKRARGLMVRYICDHQIETINAIKQFDLEGYYFDEAHSTHQDWVFVLEQ